MTDLQTLIFGLVCGCSGGLIAWALLKLHVASAERRAEEASSDAETYLKLASDWYCRWENERRHSKRGPNGRFVRRG